MSDWYNGAVSAARRRLQSPSGISHRKDSGVDRRRIASVGSGGQSQSFDPQGTKLRKDGDRKPLLGLMTKGHNLTLLQIDIAPGQRRRFGLTKTRKAHEFSQVGRLVGASILRANASYDGPELGKGRRVPNGLRRSDLLHAIQRRGRENMVIDGKSQYSPESSADICCNYGRQIQTRTTTKEPATFSDPSRELLPTAF